MTEVAQERRALTVLFCDAVGFTSLSESRELEDVDRLRSSFLTTCRAAVDRYGGHVHEILGDGVVAYFGYCVAREHDVYRAVLAGLSIVSSLQSEQGTGAETIGARVGIDTGVVLLTRAGEGPETLARRALGTPPNRAARLQALASPNSVVVTRDVQIQISRDFGVVSLGMHHLHNVPAPMEVFQISDRSQRFSRFDLLGAAPSPFVDRVEPAEYLLAAWDRAQRHENVPPVLITGEAGVGKSRLLTEVLTRADAFPSVISLHCSAYADVSPLYPIRVGLEQYAGLGQGLTADAVVGFVTGLGMDPGANVPLIAMVLGREPLPGYPLPELMPNLLRDRLLDCLCEVIVTVAGRSPVMLMIEDLQWADETTRALLARLVNDGLPGGLHVVATAREETAWPANTPPPTALRLSRLATRDTVALVGALAAGLPVDDIGEIAVRSEGLPLFAEQLVFAHGYGAPGRARASKASDVPQLIVQLAQERLDLLGPAKRTAQMAAVIGREFDVALLEASVDRLDRDDATRTPSADVADHIDLLVRSAIVESAPSGSSALQFRHALIRDATYESLLAAEARRLHHDAVARVLTEDPRFNARPDMSVIAHHLGAAGRYLEAIAQHSAAAVRAQSQGAVSEAMAELDRALALLDRVPSEHRPALELQLRAGRGYALSSSSGYADPDVREDFRRCIELCRLLGAVPGVGIHLVPARLGLWGFYCASGQMNEAHAIALELAAESELGLVKGGRASVDACLGVEAFYRGDLLSAERLLGQVLALVDDDVDPSQWVLPNDPFGASAAFLGPIGLLRGDSAALDRYVTWGLGRCDAITDRFPQAPFTRAFVRNFESWASRMVGDVERAERAAHEQLELGERYGFQDWSVTARIQLAAARAMGDEAPLEALSVMVEWLDVYWKVLGGEVLVPVLQLEAAARYVELDEIGPAEKLMSDAAATIDAGGQRLAEPELLRLRGVLARRRHQPESLVEHWFEQALHVATMQGNAVFANRVTVTATSSR